MRHKRKDSPVASLEEERHARNQPKHGVHVFGIRRADGDQKGAGNDGKGMNEVLFGPDIGAAVQLVRDEASQRPEDDVQEPKHGCPITAPRLAQRSKVLNVVGAENGVDGQLRAERAKVCARDDEGL